MVLAFADAYATAGLLIMLLLLVQRFIFKGRQHLASLQGKHVVITGGSSGIGLALAMECLSQGASVSLLARDPTRLSSAASTLLHSAPSSQHNILLKAVDVTDANAVSAAIVECFQWKPIDVLICNAGTVVAGLFDKVNAKDIDVVTRTNLLGCVYPILAALPVMKARSKHHPSSIVFVSSSSCLLFLAGVNMYTATKYAIKGLAETLRFELMSYNIKVSLACPGFVETAMLDEADKAEALNFKFMSKVNLYNRANAQSADEVARRMMKGVKQGEFLITTDTAGITLGVMGRGFVPADSLLQACIELIMLVPLRLASLVWYAYVKRVLRGVQPEP